MSEDNKPDTPFLDFLHNEGLSFASSEDQQPFFASARAQRVIKEERDATIADTVHYQASDIECWAAIVTATDPFSDAVALTAFPAGAVVVKPLAGVEHDEDRKMGTWHWGHE